MGCDMVPQLPRYINNPDDPKGFNIDLPGVCTSKGYVWETIKPNVAAAYLPLNNEYVLSNEPKGCYYCSLRPGREINCSAGCDGISCCSITGSGYTFYRNSYNADPLQCCLNTTLTIGNETCDPSNRDGSSVNCKALMKEYCKGANLQSNQYCIQWCAENKDVCNGFMKSRCNDINALFFDPSCKEFCLDNPGMCDSASRTLCSNNNPDPYCACINSDVNLYRENPVCQDANCVKSGYKTNDMITLSQNGCTIMDCGVYINLKDVNNFVFKDNTISQKCGGSITKDNDSIQNVSLVAAGSISRNTNGNTDNIMGLTSTSGTTAGTAKSIDTFDIPITNNEQIVKEVPGVIPETPESSLTPESSASDTTNMIIGIVFILLILIGIIKFFRK